MSAQPKSRHWSRSVDENRVCWLVFDKQDSSTNVMSSETVSELENELAQVEALSPTALVIRSGKDSGFIAGADITEFGDFDDAALVTAMASRGQAVCQRVADLPFPTVAALNGFTLGGGLEVALACDYRVAVRDYRRCIGLPEVQLGFNPGWGGTVRSVQLLGAPVALDLMLTGRMVSPVEAEKMGLVDRLAESDALEDSVNSLLAAKPQPRRASFSQRLLNLAPIRPLVAKKVRARVSRRAKPEHYPAPFAIVDLWQRFGAKGRQAFDAEADLIGQLMAGDTSKNLIRVFFLRERLKKLAPKESRVSNVHVVGAGVMGGDIASWCALRGLNVSLQDREMRFVEPAIARAKKLFARRLRGPGDAEAAEQRLSVDLDGDRVADADVIIEAIIEDVGAKQDVFRALERSASPNAILATNTSSIGLEDIAETFDDPSRLVGLHFFNPVARLPLVEVVKSENSDEDAVSRAMSFATQIGKLPLPCRSAPGFVVNRILAPYMLEALRAHEEGTPIETIDKAATDFGMPTGPVELSDRVGLDISLHVTESLCGVAPEMLRQKVAAGDLGAKTGRGFYRFENNRPQRAKDFPAPDQDLQDRLILLLVNEAMACFEEGIVDDLDLLDAGVIFGTGFAPFRGGPIHYAKETGVDAIVDRLEDLAKRFGTQFTPRPGWRELAHGR